METNSIRLVLLLLLSFVGTLRSAEIKLDQLGKMVLSDRQKQGQTGDSLLTPLKVIGIGERMQDYYIVPVVRNGELIAVYRHDAERGLVTELVSGASVKSLKLDLFTQEGVQRYLAAHNIAGGTPVLISIGPLSLFGTIGTGWYSYTNGSFCLLSLSGKLIREDEVRHLWPDKLELIKQVRTSTSKN